MPKATPSLITQAQTERANLVALRDAARVAGAKELAAVAQRALNEFNHPAFTGAENTNGMNNLVPR